MRHWKSSHPTTTPSLYRARGWQIGSVSYDWLPEHARSLLFVPLDLGSS